MALTTLSLPYSTQNSGNANTAQYYQLRIPNPPLTHTQAAHFIAGQDDNFVHQSHHVNDEHNRLLPATLDDAMIPERPAGATTTAHSPFPEVGERRGLPYTSDEESETTGTELESETDGVLMGRRNKYDESAVLPQSPLLQQQMGPPVYTTSDPLETSLESRSLQSSTSLGVDQLQRRVSDGDISRHSPFQHVQQDDDLETRGRFTSASATPNSQQKVLLLDRTRQAELDSAGEDQESENNEHFKPEEDPRGSNGIPLANEPASSS
jgi:hypothetical protein